MGRFTGILGLLTMLGLAYAFSTNRRAIRLKTVAWGLGLQLVFAVFVLRVETGRRVFQKAGDVVNRLLSYAFVGSEFVFGELGKQGSHLWFYFAFQVLPTIIFIATACIGLATKTISELPAIRETDAASFVASSRIASE